jgi:hypothetical protein
MVKNIREYLLRNLSTLGKLIVEVLKVAEKKIAARNENNEKCKTAGKGFARTDKNQTIASEGQCGGGGKGFARNDRG